MLQHTAARKRITMRTCLILSTFSGFNEILKMAPEIRNKRGKIGRKYRIILENCVNCQIQKTNTQSIAIIRNIVRDGKSSTLSSFFCDGCSGETDRDILQKGKLSLSNSSVLSRRPTPDCLINEKEKNPPDIRIKDHAIPDP